ncbi:MAG: thymidine kinase, partial [Deltaproteobacteria bacterium]|nr:thymidine kinase [Deltaproteobacteria bacterium]
IVAGLDQDYLGKPFGPMPRLLAIADEVTKLKAVCMVCGGEATKSQRLVADQQQVVVGAEQHYEARCRLCFEPVENLKMEAEASVDAEGETPRRTATQ